MAGNSRVAALLAAAFQELPTARWIAADPDERLKAVLGQFEMLAEHAETHGGIIASGDLDGAVIWFDHTEPPPPIPDYDRRLREASGDHYERFARLDRLMEHYHPTEPHVYVALVGVREQMRGKGIARAMLHELHERLDKEETPAYLEAVSTDTVRLYESLGYRAHAKPFHLEDGGPALYPMWRHPSG